MIKLKIDLQDLADSVIVDVNDKSVILNSELVIDIKDGAYYLSDCQTELFFESYSHYEAIDILLPVDSQEYAVSFVDTNHVVFIAGNRWVSVSINNCWDVTLDIEFMSLNDTENCGMYDAPLELVNHAIDDSLPMRTRLLDVVKHCVAGAV